MSAKVWWPLALVGVVALVLSVPLANRAADQSRADAARWAAATSEATLEPLTSSGATDADISAAASSIVAAHPTLSAVRVWSASHDLLVSSDAGDTVDSKQAINDADLDRALADGTTWLVTDRTMTGEDGPATFESYTVIKGGGGSVVAEFAAPDAAVLRTVHNVWMGFRVIAGLGTLLAFAFALLSMRVPLARIGAGVPFYPENVPPWLRVIDVDRAVGLEQAGDRAKDRLEGLQQRLDESERLRMKAEGELQQALTALGTGGKMASPVIVPEPIAVPTPRPTPEAAAAAMAAAEEKKRVRAAQAAEKQRAKAAAAAEKERASEAAREKQAADKEAAEQRAAAKRATEKEAAAKRAAARRAPKPAATAPRSAPAQPAAPRPDVPAAAAATPPEVTVRADDVSVSAAPGRHAKKDAWPEVVVVPEQQPANVAVGGGPDSDREVLDVLHRLVPDHDADPEPADDTSELRSRLARTAALKKPGSRERQERRDDTPP